MRALTAALLIASFAAGAQAPAADPDAPQVVPLAENEPPARETPELPADGDDDTQRQLQDAYAEIQKLGGGMCAAAQEAWAQPVKNACVDKGPQECVDILASNTSGKGQYEEIKGETVEYDDASNKLGDLTNRALDAVGGVLGATGLQGVVDNLLPGNLLGYLQNIGEELDDPQSLGYSYSGRPIKWISLRASAFATPEPELNPIVKQRLIADNTLGSTQDRIDRLDLGDDYYVSLEASLLTPWTGRDAQFSVDPHIGLANAVFGSEASRRGQIQDHLGIIESYSQITDPQTIEAVACAIAITNQDNQSLVARLQNSRLNGYSRFVHNQPQLTVRYKQLHRDDLVGADVHNGRVWFGTGIANNLSWLRWFTSCGNGFDSTECAADYTDLARGWLMEHGVGVSGYYEKGNIADISVPVADAIAPGGDDPLGGILDPGTGEDASNVGNVEIQGGKYWRSGWSIGGTLVYPGTSGDGSATGYSLRLDAGMDYFRYYGNTLRLKHDLRRVTLTYKKGPVSIPLNLIYRTKSEFSSDLLDDIVVSIGAGLGL